MSYPKGKKHHNWKGDKVGNNSLHEWLRTRIKKPKLCVKCNKNIPKDLASKNGIYNRDLKNWEWLCRSCHLIKDGRDHKGEKNGGVKLTAEKVISIRKEYKYKKISMKKLGKKYNVFDSTICNIINRKSWSHIK